MTVERGGLPPCIFGLMDLDSALLGNERTDEHDNYAVSADPVSSA